MSRPCSMNQARSASIVVRACRSQSRLRATLVSPSGRSRALATNASSTSRSTWARAARDHVVLDPGEDLAGVHPVVDAALEPAGDAAEHVLLAEAQHRLLVGRVEQAGLLVPLVAAGQHVLDRREQLAGAGPLQHGLDRQPGDEADHAELVHVLELAGVVGQQALGDQLEEHVVVALEGGEDVGVGLERVEAVGAEVARAAARLAALLDGAGGVPGAERLEPGRVATRAGAAAARPPRPRSAAGRRRRRAAAGRRTPGRSAARRCGRAAGRAGAGACRSRGSGPPRGGSVASNWRRRTAYRTAMASATLDALMPAPPTQTRPWTRVPSMVKKRRLGFSIGAGVDAVLGHVGELVEQVGPAGSGRRRTRCGRCRRR